MNAFAVFAECDMEYVSPLEFRDDDEGDEAENGGNGVKNGGGADDAYDRIVRGSLRKIEEQKVSWLFLLLLIIT